MRTQDILNNTDTVFDSQHNTNVMTKHSNVPDHEVQMARADLYKLAKYAIKLHELIRTIPEDQGLEGWVQAKITKASDYISSVYHYLEYEMKFMEDSVDEQVMGAPGSPAASSTPGMVKMAKVGPDGKPIGTPIMVKSLEIPAKQSQGLKVIGEMASAGASSAGGIAGNATGFASGGIGTQQRRKKVSEFSKEPSPERGDGGGNKFMPWSEFVNTIASLTKNDFTVNQKSGHKTQVKAKFVPLDPYTHGPTMVYAYNDTRKTMGGKERGVGVRCEFQIGTYEKGAGSDPSKTISVFKLPSDPKLRRLDMTYENAVMLADIINSNTAGALKESTNEDETAKDDNEETYRVEVKLPSGSKFVRVQAGNDAEAEQKAMSFCQKKNLNPVSAKSQGIYYAEGKKNETGPKFTGYYKGTDKGRPGKKMVGSD
jgi:hypothetical protein